MVVVNSANTAPAQGLMFYVSVGVVGALLTMICVLIVILAIVIKSPRKKVNDNEQLPMPAIHINPETSNGTNYELYNDQTDDVPSSVASQNPKNPEPMFDNAIYNVPEVQQAGSKTENVQNTHIQSKTLSTPILVSAYAISNLHCSTNQALSTISEQSDDDYDSAE